MAFFIFEPILQTAPKYWDLLVFPGNARTSGGLMFEMCQNFSIKLFDLRCASAAYCKKELLPGPARVRCWTRNAAERSSKDSATKNYPPNSIKVSFISRNFHRSVIYLPCVNPLVVDRAKILCAASPELTAVKLSCSQGSPGCNCRIARECTRVN